MNREEIPQQLSDIWIDAGLARRYADTTATLEIKKALDTEVALILRDHAKSLDPNGIGLSIGAGHFPHYELFNQLGLTPIGVDISEPMRQQAIENGVPEGNYIVQDLSYPLELSKPVALGEATNVFYNLTDDTALAAAIGNIRSLMQTDGILVIVNPIPEPDNSKLIKREMKLRFGRGVKTGLRFLADIALNGGVKQHVKEQKMIAERSRRATSLQWAEFFAAGGFKLVEERHSKAYADQASIQVYRAVS